MGNSQLKKNVLLGVMVLGIFSCQSPSNNKKEIKASKPVRDFTYGSIQLLKSPFRHAQNLDKKILLEKYDPNRFLARLAPLAGLKPKAPAYEGWTSWATGHAMGHYLSACSMAFATSGRGEFKNRVNTIVNELALIQEKSGSGYISKPEYKKTFETEIAKGDVRSQGFLLNGMKVPLYTMHKILSGLRDASRLTENPKALTVEKRFADWIYTQLMPLSDADFEKVLACEHGGIAESLADLYKDTENKKYLKFSKRFYDPKLMDPIFHDQDNLAGLHANTQIPKYIGLARIFELDSSKRERKTAENFWDIVVNHHSYATGGNSYHEHFGPADQLNDYLDDKTTETCNVYNMLKLSNHIFNWQPKAKIADYMERAMLNHSLVSQNPENGKVMYYLPLGMPSLQKFQDPYSFTCCVCSGMEHHFLYKKYIYAHNDDQLYLNQFIASRVHWKKKEIQIIQNTKFPLGESSQLTFKTDRPKNFTLFIRKPEWLKKEMRIELNGKKIEFTFQKNGYYAIKRAWKNGDQLQLDFPFSLHTESIPDNPDRIAIFNGPVLLGGDFGSSKKLEKGNSFLPVLLTKNKPINDWVKPIAGTKNFKSKGIVGSSTITLKPFFELYADYRTVYWDTFTPEEWKKKKEFYIEKRQGFKNLKARTVDFFQPGEMQPEREHGFSGNHMKVVEFDGVKGREAKDGSFSFEMKVLPHHPMALVQKYWGNIDGNQKASFSIYVDDHYLTEKIIHWSGGFFKATNSIPKELTKGKNKVTISFRTKPGFQAGPLCGVRMIKTDDGKQ